MVQVIGYVKRKSAVSIARMYWDEESIKKYIREQEVEDNRLDQLEMFNDNKPRQPPLGGP